MRLQFAIKLEEFTILKLTFYWAKSYISPSGYELNDTSHKRVGKEKDDFCRAFFLVYLKTIPLGEDADHEIQVTAEKSRKMANISKPGWIVPVKNSVLPRIHCDGFELLPLFPFSYNQKQVQWILVAASDPKKNQIKFPGCWKNHLIRRISNIIESKKGISK